MNLRGFDGSSILGGGAGSQHSPAASDITPPNSSGFNKPKSPHFAFNPHQSELVGNIVLYIKFTAFSLKKKRIYFSSVPFLASVANNVSLYRTVILKELGARGLAPKFYRFRKCGRGSQTFTV